MKSQMSLYKLMALDILLWKTKGVKTQRYSIYNKSQLDRNTYTVVFKVTSQQQEEEKCAKK